MRLVLYTYLLLCVLLPIVIVGNTKNVGPVSQCPTIHKTFKNALKHIYLRYKKIPDLKINIVKII